MKIRTVVAASALAAAMAAPSFAQQGFGGGAQMTPEQRAAAFDAADKNKDGSLDKVEFKASLPEQFQAQIDDARLEQMFGRRDADKDGKVTKAEYTAPMQGRGGGGGPPPGN